MHGRTVQLLTNHVAVETDRSVRRFGCEGLNQPLTKTFVVETSYISMCFYCYVVGQQLPSPTYAMSLYQITVRMYR